MKRTCIVSRLLSCLNVLTCFSYQLSSCVAFQALAKQNFKGGRGVRYTGVGGMVCGTLEMVIPTAVANLEKGER